MNLAKSPTTRCKSCHTPSTGKVGSRCGVTRFSVTCNGVLEAPQFKVVDLKSNKFLTFDIHNPVTALEDYAAIVPLHQIGSFLKSYYGHEDPKQVAEYCTILIVG